MKKIASILMSILMVLTLLAVPNQTVYAASASISVSASSVNIGDSITVTVAVPEGITATIDVSYPSNLVSFSNCSTTASNSGSAVSMNLGSFSSRSATITFTATSAGTATFTATPITAGSEETAEQVPLDAASASVTIANQVTTPTTPSTPTTTVSDNNQLGWLQISPGTLSPGFHPDTTNYKVTVGYDVTKISISAIAAHEKAKVTSVSGGSNLQVGENTVTIVVQAENGVTKTYKIVVTRQAQTETPETTGSETDEPATTTVEEKFSWNGSDLEFVDKIPDSVIPTGFTKTERIINNKEVPVLDFKDGKLTVMYLSNESGDNSLYVYDEKAQDVYPFVTLGDEDRYVIVLRPDDASAPAGYLSCTLSIEGKGLISAYQFNVEELLDDDTTSWFGAESYYAAEPSVSDFYLIYCLNKDGDFGWYQYDAVEGSFQRYAAALFASTAVSAPEAEDKDSSLDLEGDKTHLLIMGAEAAVIVILIIVVIILAVKLRRGNEDDFYDEEYDDEEYDDEDYDVESMMEEETVIEDELVADEIEDDEIEIEFYEMPATESEPVETESEVFDIPDIPDMEALLVKEALGEKEEQKKQEETPKRVVTAIFDDDDDGLEFIDLD